MNQLNLFIELTRLKKPIGYMLLFWPCAWGLTIAYDFDTSCRRTTRQGEWPNKADSVPVDFRGGWLESWMVYHIGIKTSK